MSKVSYRRTCCGMRVSLAVVIVLVLWCFFPSKIVADENAGSEYLSMDGLYKYTFRNTSEISLQEYLGEETKWIVPEVIDGYRVVEIAGDGMLLEGNQKIQTVTIPATVQTVEIGAFSGAETLRDIRVLHGNNEGLYDEDGVLYYKDFIIAYPGSKPEKFYHIKNGTTTICRGAFYGNRYLQTVVIPNTVTTVGSRAFALCSCKMDVYFKQDSFQKMTISENAFWNMLEGSRCLVKTEELKNALSLYLRSNDAYRNQQETMAIEIAVIAAQQLLFKNQTNCMEQVLHINDRRLLHELYNQVPDDTTENVKWESLNPAICRIINQKYYEAMCGGKTILKGEDESGHTILLHVKVEQPIDQFVITAQTGSDIKVGETGYIEAEIYPENAYAVTEGISWSSDNCLIAQVKQDSNMSCLVTGIMPGKAVITATASDNGKRIKKDCELRIYDSIKACKIDPIPEQTYTGQAIMPEVIVRYGDYILKQDVDYTVESGMNTKVGEAWLKIRGIGYFYTVENPYVQAAFSIVADKINTEQSIVQKPEISNQQQNAEDAKTDTNDSGTQTVFSSKTLSKKVKHINAKLCKNNKKIKRVVIENNIQTIGAEAFAGCSNLTSIYIGKNVKKIGKKAFYKCNKVNKITIRSKKLSIERVGSKAFSGIGGKKGRKVKVTVPKSKKKSYKKLLKKRGVKGI